MTVIRETLAHHVVGSVVRAWVLSGTVKVRLRLQQPSEVQAHSTCVCIKAFPASGVGRGPGRSNTKSRSRSGSDAETPRGAPADVIQSQLFDMCSCCDAALAASLWLSSLAAAVLHPRLAAAACAGGLRGLNPCVIMPPAPSGAAIPALQKAAGCEC